MILIKQILAFMDDYSFQVKNRAFLMKKLLTICPICNRVIYGKDLDLSSLFKCKIEHWPIMYVHCHSYKNYPIHALTLYLDSNFSVRSSEVSEFIKIDFS